MSRGISKSTKTRWETKLGIFGHWPLVTKLRRTAVSGALQETAATTCNHRAQLKFVTHDAERSETWNKCSRDGRPRLSAKPRETQRTNWKRNIAKTKQPETVEAMTNVRSRGSTQAATFRNLFLENMQRIRTSETSFLKRPDLQSIAVNYRNKHNGVFCSGSAVPEGLA